MAINFVNVDLYAQVNTFKNHRHHAQYSYFIIDITVCAVSKSFFWCLLSKVYVDKCSLFSISISIIIVWHWWNVAVWIDTISGYLIIQSVPDWHQTLSTDLRYYPRLKNIPMIDFAVSRSKLGTWDFDHISLKATRPKTFTDRFRRIFVRDWWYLVFETGRFILILGKRA